jgi:membrane protease YdiL (CAAX protease family)
MDATYAALHDLHPPMWVRALLVTAVTGLVLTDALIGRRDHRTLVTALAATPADAEGIRARFLYRWAVMGWAAAITAVLLVAILPAVSPTDLGLHPPDLSRLAPGGDEATAVGLVAGLAIAIVVGLLISTLAMRIIARRRGHTGSSLPASVEPMLPVGRRDRRAWIALSVAAGITEEVTYRGLALLAVATAVPVGRVPAMVITSALFGLAHAYQGINGILATAVAGAAFTALYLSTGSLLPGMVAHTLVDLRALLLRPGRVGPEAARPDAAVESPGAALGR